MLYVFTYVCIDVCMLVCMYVCKYVRIYTCMYVCMYACMFVCMYICIYICLESDKEAGGAGQCSQGSSKNCTSRESVSPLSRLIRGFPNKYH